MRNHLFNAYGKSPSEILLTIDHLNSIPAYPGEEHIKQDTLRDLHTLLECALIDDCRKFKSEQIKKGRL